MGSGSLADPAWRIVAAADFDADGGRDLVFQHQEDGRLAVWLMDGTTFRASRPLSPAQVPDTMWKIRAAGDLDRDGWPDLIWQHETTGQPIVWFMNGVWLREAQAMTPDIAVGRFWRVVGAGDMNGDGHVDIVWQYQAPPEYQATGGMAVWLMEGSAIKGEVDLLHYTHDPYWNIRAVTDVNGDLQPDFVLQNYGNGELWVWLMNGTSREGLGERFSIPVIYDNRWQIAGPK